MGDKRLIEYRVVWRRADGKRRYKRYASLASAEKFALVLQGRMQEVTGEDPDAYACCSGFECGCGGETWADHWAQVASRIPPLAEGPRIDSRVVGAWQKGDPHD